MSTGTGDLFGAADVTVERITHREKILELERELRLREAVYPKQIEAGRLDEARAKRQVAVLQAILEDYNVRPWPHTRELVRQWRPAAEPLTVLGVRAVKMHRDELLAVLAFAVDAFRRAGLVAPADLGTNGAKNETTAPKSETRGRRRPPPEG